MTERKVDRKTDPFGFGSDAISWGGWLGDVLKYSGFSVGTAAGLIAVALHVAPNPNIPAPESNKTIQISKKPRVKPATVADIDARREHNKAECARRAGRDENKIKLADVLVLQGICYRSGSG
jgi:hypothetical protein